MLYKKFAAVIDRLNLLSDQELLYLANSKKLWLETNPNGQIRFNCYTKIARNHIRNEVETKVALAILGPSSKQEANAFIFPAEAYEPIRSRLYYLFFKRLDRSIQDINLLAEKYRLSNVCVEYLINDQQEIVALFEQKNIYKDSIRKFNTVINRFNNYNLVNVLDMGVGQSKFINMISKQLRAVGVEKVNRYGIGLSELTKIPKLTEPCFIGNFEDYDFGDLKFDLLYSNLGASFYTLNPFKYLQKLSKIMNQNAVAWLNVYDFEDWQDILGYFPEFDFEYLYNMRFLYGLLNKLIQDFNYDPFENKKATEPTVVLAYRK